MPTLGAHTSLALSTIIQILKDDVLIEKTGHIKNPLTVIAMFAAIAEISGATVLPFVIPENQSIYIWFLMLFPFFLVGIFFITLNFNRDALYAPSDYKDEKNFIFHRIKSIEGSENKAHQSSYDEIKTTLEKLKYEQDIHKLHDEINRLETRIEKLKTAPQKAESQQSNNELLIDLSAIGEGLISTEFKESNMLQDLLNSIYFEFLFNHVPTFSYGRKWQLVNDKTGEVIIKDGNSDTRNLSKVGISKNYKYRVELI